MNITKKLYDCYAILEPLAHDNRIKVSVIKDDYGFALKINDGSEKNYIRDISQDGAIQLFINTYTTSSIDMILDELGYIPQHYLGKDEKEFIEFRKALNSRIREVSIKQESWINDR